MKTTKSTGARSQLWLPLAAACVLLGVTSTRAASYSDEVKADNPVAYYRLEETAGATTLEDAMGSYPGEFIYNMDADGNPDYPRLGQGGLESNSASFHSFAAADQSLQVSYAAVPYAEALNPQGPQSIEVWVRPTGHPANGENRVPLGNFGGWGDSSGWFIYQRRDAENAPSYWVWIMKGGGIWLGGGDVTPLQWCHMVAVFDGQNITFYVNGEQKSQTVLTDYIANSSQPLLIGGFMTSDTVTRFWDGNVDEVAIYNTALSVARIQAHYQVGLTSIRVPATPPSIITAPVAVSSYAGHTAKFTVTADGTAPLSFQWYRGTTPIAGATTDTLSFTCAAADDGAAYKVVVTNLLGSVTSTSATLTVLKGLELLSSPASITRYTGSMAAFYVGAGGASPIGYQWYKGAAMVKDATNATLWLSDVQLSDDATTYSARVSNAFTNTTSEVATLTVVARPKEVPATGYAAIVMADGPTAFWRLDETEGSEVVVDAAGSFDGTFDNANGAGVFTYGVPAGIPNETNPGLGVSQKARVVVPYALELNPHGAFSLEAWLKPASLAADGADYRTAFSSEGDGVGGPTGWLVYQQPDNTWAWVIFSDYWINAFLALPDAPIVANTWYHMVLVYDGSLFKSYINGVQKGEDAVDSFVQNQNGAVNLGWRKDNDWKPWDGTLDEVAFYNKALTLEQITNHYQNSVNAKVSIGITRTGADVVLTWSKGTLQASDKVAGGTFTPVSGATSPFTTSATGTAKFYRVVVQ